MSRGEGGCVLPAGCGGGGVGFPLLGAAPRRLLRVGAVAAAAWGSLVLCGSWKPASRRPLLAPSCPCLRAVKPLWPHFQRFPGSGTAVFAKFPGKGGGAPSSGGCWVPASLWGGERACRKPGRGGLLEAVFSEDARGLGNPPLKLLANCCETLATSHGWKKSAIAEGEERGKCCCLLPRSCRPGGGTPCQDWG